MSPRSPPTLYLDPLSITPTRTHHSSYFARLRVIHEIHSPSAEAAGLPPAQTIGWEDLLCRNSKLVEKGWRYPGCVASLAGSGSAGSEGGSDFPAGSDSPNLDADDEDEEEDDDDDDDWWKPEPYEPLVYEMDEEEIEEQRRLEEEIEHALGEGMDLVVREQQQQREVVRETIPLTLSAFLRLDRALAVVGFLKRQRTI